MDNENPTGRYLDDDELWEEITRHAEERSGEYVDGQDDLELQISPFSPFVENNKNYEFGNG